MTRSIVHDPQQSFDIEAMIAADPDEFGRLLGPIMAGARARGVADAFELMGVAAVLIDGAGQVLHAGGRAERALLPLVRIVGNHLVGRDGDTNSRLQGLIESGLCAGRGSFASPVVTLSDADGRPRLSMRAMNVPDSGPAGTQLLRLVIVVTDITV